MNTTETNQKVIAAFDFDGTLIKGDSLFYFFLFRASIWKIIRNLIPALYYISLHKLKLMPNFKAKEHLFILFYRNMPKSVFDRKCEQFTEILERKLKSRAIEKLKWHQQMKHEVVIISASVENWIIPLANRLGIHVVIGTKLAVDNGRLTGKFQSKNCYGSEKVNRLKTHYSAHQNYILYAYGDSKGDRELLAIAEHPFYRSF